MTEPVRISFRAQAASCAALGSPFMARVLNLLANGLQPGAPVADRILGWQGDATSRGDAVALRLAGGLHGLALGEQDTALQALYKAPAKYSDDETLAILLAAIASHPAALLCALASAPQTNEVRRSAVVIGAAHYCTRQFGLPLVLSELGASAGLNLNWDQYAMTAQGRIYGNPASPVRLTPDWRGTLPPVAPPTIAARAAVDLNPLNPTADETRILSYIWPDQTHRITLTRAALMMAQKHGISVERGEAIDWLEQRLAQPRLGHLHLIYHTVAWQYFPKSAQARGETLLSLAGANATPEAPIAHLSMESDGAEPGAALVLRLWPGNHTLPLGRADFHGRWIDWQV